MNQSKWEARFIFLVDGGDMEKRQCKFFHCYSNQCQYKLRYIEIWENTGELITPNDQGTLLNGAEDHQFNTGGKIVRINPDECTNFIADP